MKKKIDQLDKELELPKKRKTEKELEVPIDEDKPVQFIKKRDRKTIVKE